MHDTTAERRSLENPLSPQWDMPTWRTDAFGFGYAAASGVIVTRDTVLNYAAAWRAVNIIASSVAKIPFRVYRTGDSGTPQPAVEHPAYKLLRRRPNEYMTPYTLKQTVMGHVLVLGNAYLYIERNAAAEPTGLLPLTPDVTYPVRVDGRLLYVTQIDDGSGRREFIRLPAADMIHVKGLSYDGLVGYSLISKAKDSLGLGMAAGLYASRFYSNNATPSAVIEVPGAMPENAQREFIRQWNSMHQGIDNSHRVAIVTNGGKLSALSFSAADAQILETRKFEIREVALWFGLPPHLLGDDSRTSYNSLEQENQSYLDHTLDPWLTALEEECDEKLLTEEEKRADSHYTGFDRSEVVRVDSSTLTSTLTQQLNNGLRSPDEARAKMNLPGYPNGLGQRFRQPTNIGYVGQPAAAAGTAPAASPSPPPPAREISASAAQRGIPAAHLREIRGSGAASQSGFHEQRLQTAERDTLADAFARAFRRLGVALDREVRDLASLPAALDGLADHRDQLAAIVAAPLHCLWASAGLDGDPTPAVVQALLDCAADEGRAVAHEFRGANGKRHPIAAAAERWEHVYPGEFAAAVVRAAHAGRPFEIRYSPDQPRGPDGRWIAGGTAPGKLKKLWREAHDARAAKAQAATERALRTGKASDHAKAAAAHTKAAEAAAKAGRDAQARAHQAAAAEHNVKAGQPKPPPAPTATKTAKPTAARPAAKPVAGYKEKQYRTAATRADKATRNANETNTLRAHHEAERAHVKAADAARMAHQPEKAAEHEAAAAEHRGAMREQALRMTSDAADTAQAQFDRSYKPPPYPRQTGKGADVDRLHEALQRNDRPLERVRVGVEAATAAGRLAGEHFEAARQRLDRAEDAWKDAMPRVQSDPKGYRAALKEVEAAREDFNVHAAINASLRAATHETVDRTLKVTGQPGKVTFQSIGKGVDRPLSKGDSGQRDYEPVQPLLQSRVDQAHQWLSNKTHESTIHGGQSVVTAQITASTPLEDQRAFHSPAGHYGDNRSRIGLSAHDDVPTVIHEFGHAIEDRNAEAHAHLQAFLRERCGDETPTNLKDQFGGGYKAYEQGRKDDFEKTFNPTHSPVVASAYYVGKDYHGHASEVLSMGMQKLFEDAGHFSRSDPEFFKLVVGIMHGHLAGRQKP